MKQFLLCLIFSAAITAQSQTSYGIKGGLNMTKLTYSDDSYETSMRPSFYLGGWGNYGINERFSLQAELLLSREGSKEKDVRGSTGKLNFLFLQLPLLARYKIYDQFYAEAGPQFGFLLSGKGIYNGTEYDMKEFLKTVDLRFPIGAGYEFTKDQLKGLSVGIRYAFSLVNANSEPVFGVNGKNRSLQLGVAYRLK